MLGTICLWDGSRTDQVSVSSTGIHWHGLRQHNSNNQDGAGGITECPIAPGSSRSYTFRAVQYGTSWYHSHFSVQVKYCSVPFLAKTSLLP